MKTLQFEPIMIKKPITSKKPSGGGGGVIVPRLSLK